jgi:hypothetical protein
MFMFDSEQIVHQLTPNLSDEPRTVPRQEN